MSSTINTRIQVKRDTTENWNNAQGFVPLQGEIIVYTDYSKKTYVVEEYGQQITKTVDIPNIKIGTGNSYVQDLPFVDENTRDTLMAHIQDQDIHVTLGEKAFWDNKVNIDDAYAQANHRLENETLIFNRF